MRQYRNQQVRPAVEAGLSPFMLTLCQQRFVKLVDHSGGSRNLAARLRTAVSHFICGGCPSSVIASCEVYTYNEQWTMAIVGGCVRNDSQYPLGIFGRLKYAN